MTRDTRCAATSPTARKSTGVLETASVWQRERTSQNNEFTLEPLKAGTPERRLYMLGHRRLRKDKQHESYPISLRSIFLKSILCYRIHKHNLVQYAQYLGVASHVLHPGLILVISWMRATLMPSPWIYSQTSKLKPAALIVAYHTTPCSLNDLARLAHLAHHASPAEEKISRIGCEPEVYQLSLHQLRQIR